MNSLDETSKPFDLRDLLWRVRRYAWLLALPPILVFCAASVYYTMTPPVYESTVTIAIETQSGVGAALQNMVNADRDRSSARDRTNRVSERLRNQAFLQAAADRLGLLGAGWVRKSAKESAQRYAGITEDEFAIRIASASISKRIRVAPAEGENVRIITTSGDAADAQRLASAITDMLIEESRRSSLERVLQRGQFSEDQISVYQERLTQSENALRGFQESLLRRALNRSPLDEATIGAARGVVRATDQEMDQIRTRIETARAAWAASRFDEVPPTLQSRSSADFERRLATVESNLAAASIGDAAAQQTLPALQEQVASIRLSLLLEYESLAAALPGDLSQEARSAAAGLATDRAILRTLRDKRARMASTINQFERGVQSTPRDQMELSRLQGAVQTNRELLTTLQREAQSSRLSEAYATSGMGLKMAVVDPPQLPLRPASPDPVRIFGAALLLGPLLSVGVVFAGEKLSMVVRTVEQTEQELGVRVLGTVPRIEGWKSPEGFLARRWAALSIILVLVLTGFFHGFHAASTTSARQSPPPAPSSGP